MPQLFAPRAPERWKAARSFLVAYEGKWTPTAWRWFRHAPEGAWVVGRFAALLGLAFAAFAIARRSPLLLGLVSLATALLVCDAVFVNTAIAFFSAKVKSALRSTMFAFGGLASIAAGGAVFIAPFRDRFDPPLDASRALASTFGGILNVDLGGSTPTHWSAALAFGLVTALELYFALMVLSLFVNFVDQQRGAQNASSPRCERCHGSGWVCEEHPTLPMNHAVLPGGRPCGGAGQPCPEPACPHRREGIEPDPPAS